MKIKAELFGRPITIIDIISAYDKDAKVIYVRRDGTIDTCYADTACLKITDPDYLP